MSNSGVCQSRQTTFLKIFFKKGLLFVQTADNVVCQNRQMTNVKKMTAQVMHYPSLSATADHCSLAVHEIHALGDAPDRFGAQRPWYEALIRPHASVGWSPGLFIDNLYSQRPVVDTDLEIMERATAWLRQQREPTRINVNVHPHSLTDSLFVRSAIKRQRENTFFGHSLCLELIEFGECDRKSSLIDNARKLRAAGILIALDDFGSRLNCFDLCAAGIVDILKIDTSVVCGLDRDPNQRAIVECIQTLARGLKARVIAEGVETRPQLDTLRRLEVNFAQGFFFHRPELLEI